MATPEPTPTELIRNPDSKNLLYIPQDRFPLKFHTGTGSVELQSNGTYRITPQNQQFVSGFYLDVNGETALPEMAQPIAGSASTNEYVVFYLPNSINNLVSGITFATYKNNASKQNVSGSSLGETTIGNFTIYSARIGYAISGDFNGIQIRVGMFQEASVYTNVKMGLFFTDSINSIVWESAYMEEPSTAMYTVWKFYQSPDGTWPQAPTEYDNRQGDIGSTVSLTAEDKKTTLEPPLGEYIYDSTLSTESGIVPDNGTLELKAYFKIRVLVETAMYYQRSDGTWPNEPDDTGADKSPLFIGNTLGFFESHGYNLSDMQPEESPASGVYVFDESRSVDTVTGSGTDADANLFKAFFKLQFTITFSDPTGTNTAVTQSSIDYGSATPTPPTWTRDRYEFGSWIPSLSETVTSDVTYTAQWATEGSGKSPVMLDQIRVWGDSNGYPSGTSIPDADTTALTYAQLAEMAGGTGDPMAADGSEYVTLEQFREWANSGGGGGGSPLDAYPVGSIYLSTSSTSPATLFGGTWQRNQDVFLLCAGSTYAAGKTGGEATHKLTVDEMPSHSHDVSMTVYSEQGYDTPRYSMGTRTSGGYSATLYYEATFTGGGSAHNNMPPYLSVYAWKRTK